MPGLFQQMGYCCYAKGATRISLRPASNTTISAVADRESRPLSSDRIAFLNDRCLHHQPLPCRRSFSQVHRARWEDNHKSRDYWNRRGQISRWGEVNGHPERRNNSRHCFCSANGPRDRQTPAEDSYDAMSQYLNDITASQPSELIEWKRAFALMRRRHGKEGVWACFELVLERNNLHLLLLPKAEDLRDAIIEAAVLDDTRIEIIIRVNQKLRALSHSGWPDLYVKTIHYLVKGLDSPRTLAWHRRLAEVDPPGPDDFPGIFSSLVTHTNRHLQKVLAELYVSSAGRQLYDHIIPTLFESGQAGLARQWRKRFIKLGDFPLSPRSRPFLRFLNRYYPSIKLTSEEEAIMNSTNLAGKPSPGDEARDAAALLQHQLRRDSLVAKWFASTWVSMEFAINLVYRLGVQTVGPLALQALALRDSNPAVVVNRLKQLQRLDIRIAPQIYCNALVHFAGKGNEDLLVSLVECDIHPDEFNDASKRGIIMADALQQGDLERQNLMRGIELSIESEPAPHELNNILHRVLARRQVAKAQIILDRMDAVKINITQANARSLVRLVFWRLGSHPREWGRRLAPGDRLTHLDRAIRVTRQLAAHNIPIPLQHWERLFYNLGRMGRLDELEQLTIELVQLFKSQYTQLVPVWDQAGNTRLVRQYIPVDLPFSHRQHPIHEIFDGSMQRSIARWGFDKAIVKPARIPFSHRQRPSEFDIASGVRILASLKKQGVLIEEDLLRKTVALRLAVAMAPGRAKHRTRDNHELSPAHVKDLVNEAWGSDLFGNLSEFAKLVEKQRRQSWTTNRRIYREKKDKEEEPLEKALQNRLSEHEHMQGCPS